MIALSLLGALSVAQAGDVVSVKSCTDAAPTSKLAPWAIQRTVRIEVPEGSGTGVVVSPDGFILTAAHVVAGSSTPDVVLADKTKLSGVVVRSSPESDLALIRVDQKAMPCIPVDANQAEVGSDVIIIGSPGGEALTNSVSKGIVSGYRDMDGRTVVQTDATINPGNSGGPMLGENGKVIGIVSFKVVANGVEGLGFAIAATDFGADLGLRWATETDASLFQAEAVAAKPKLLAVAPKLELPAGHAPIDTSLRYDMGYRPNTRPIGSGSFIAVLGVVGVAASYGYYAHHDVMTRQLWNADKAINAASWGTLLVGGGMIGLGFAIPSKIGPISPVSSTEAP